MDVEEVGLDFEEVRDLVVVGSLQPPNQPGCLQDVLDAVGVGGDDVVVMLGAGAGVALEEVMVDARVVGSSSLQPNHPG